MSCRERLIANAEAAVSFGANAARRHGGAITLTVDEWLGICEAFGYRCAYCGHEPAGVVGMEHIFPLRRGGDHSAANVVPACGSCNNSKHDLTLLEWALYREGVWRYQGRGRKREWLVLAAA